MKPLAKPLITTPEKVESRIGTLEFTDGMPRGNWIQTIPGRGWFVMLRFYGPLEPFFDKTWQPSEIELGP